MLQFITDGTTAEETIKQALSALDGGCRWIQVRMKDATDDEVEIVVSALLPYCSKVMATLIVDDRVEVAVRCGANGVHLGKNDMPPAEARKLLGDDKIIGATVNSSEDIDRLPLEVIDYLGIGPYRFTTTKKNLAPVLGLEGYCKIMSHLRTISNIPVVAIGGITAKDVRSLMETGVTGVAVSRAISRAENPAATTQEILELLSDQH